MRRRVRQGTGKDASRIEAAPPPVGSAVATKTPGPAANGPAAPVQDWDNDGAPRFSPAWAFPTCVIRGAPYLHVIKAREIAWN